MITRVNNKLRYLSLALILAGNFQGTVQSAEENEAVVVKTHKKPSAMVPKHLEFANDILFNVEIGGVLPLVCLSVGFGKVNGKYKGSNVALGILFAISSCFYGIKGLYRNYQLWKRAKEKNKKLMLVGNFQRTVQSAEESEVIVAKAHKKSSSMVPKHLEFATDILLNVTIKGFAFIVGYEALNGDDSTGLKVGVIGVIIYTVLNSVKDLCRGYQFWKRAREKNKKLHAKVIELHHHKTV